MNKLHNRSFEEVINETYNDLSTKGVDKNILDEAMKIVQLMKNKTGHRGIMFVSAVFIAAEKAKQPYSQFDISKISGFTEVSIRKWVREYALLVTESKVI